jgi:ATP-dependent exoDNAse (exonuclease V) beta subunit
LREQIKEAEICLITGVLRATTRAADRILRRFDRLYRERKRQAGALDFADLEEFAVRLLVNTPTRARASRRSSTTS